MYQDEDDALGTHDENTCVGDASDSTSVISSAKGITIGSSTCCLGASLMFAQDHCYCGTATLSVLGSCDPSLSRFALELEILMRRNGKSSALGTCYGPKNVDSMMSTVASGRHCSNVLINVA